MGDVVKLDLFTKKDISAADMLKAIAEENPANCFVIVWPNDGSMPAYHSSTGDSAVVLMRCQQFIHKFYNGDFEA